MKHEDEHGGRGKEKEKEKSFLVQLYQTSLFHKDRSRELLD